jgi:hypothetical protein
MQYPSQSVIVTGLSESVGFVRACGTLTAGMESWSSKNVLYEPFLPATGSRTAMGS